MLKVEGSGTATVLLFYVIELSQHDKFCHLYSFCVIHHIFVKWLFTESVTYSYLVSYIQTLVKIWQMLRLFLPLSLLQLLTTLYFNWLSGQQVIVFGLTFKPVTKGFFQLPSVLKVFLCLQTLVYKRWEQQCHEQCCYQTLAGKETYRWTEAKTQEPCKSGRNKVREQRQKEEMWWDPMLKKKRIIILLGIKQGELEKHRSSWEVNEITEWDDRTH